MEIISSKKGNLEVKYERIWAVPGHLNILFGEEKATHRKCDLIMGNVFRKNEDLLILVWHKSGHQGYK
jgi:hypothetical protein